MFSWFYFHPWKTQLGHEAQGCVSLSLNMSMNFVCIVMSPSLPSHPQWHVFKEWQLLSIAPSARCRFPWTVMVLCLQTDRAFIYSKWHFWPSPSPYCSFKSALISLHKKVRALEGQSVPKQASSDKTLSIVGWKPPVSGYWLRGNQREWRCDLAAKWQKDLEWGWFFPLLPFWFNQTFSNSSG